MRDGILHQGMPKASSYGKAVLPTWILYNNFARPMQMGKANGGDALMVQPWLFVETVLQLWRENIALIDENDSFPWANVIPMTIEQVGSQNP